MSYHLYADDLQVYTQTSLSHLHEAFDTTNFNLRRILDWSKFFGISVNPDKT